MARTSRTVGVASVLALGLGTITMAQPAGAAGAVRCGQHLTRSTTLTADIGPCRGDGLVVDGGHGITVDLAGHKVTGIRARGNNSVGIRLRGATGVTVTNGHVSGFDAGVALVGGSANVVSDLDVHDNIGTLDNPFNVELGDGILVDGSSANRLVGNVIAHNGPLDGIAVVDVGADDNVIQGNVIEDNDLVQVLHVDGEDIPLATDRGIFVASFSPPSGPPIRGTKIVDNVVQRNAANGIETFVVTQLTTIAGNVVLANGFPNATLDGGSAGLEIGDAGIVKGDGSGHATITDNEVHGNAGGGIMLIGCCGSPFTYLDGHNKVLSNDAADNVASAANDVAAADLWDTAVGDNCETDRWFANIWGRGGFLPPCTTVGGSGPPNPVPLAAAPAASASPSALAPSSLAAVPTPHSRSHLRG